MAVPLTTVTLIVLYNGFGHRVSGGGEVQIIDMMYK
jgi:hypothetical protein